MLVARSAEQLGVGTCRETNPRPGDRALHDRGSGGGGGGRTSDDRSTEGCQSNASHRADSARESAPFCPRGGSFCTSGLFLLRQRVQTYARVALPLRSTRTCWRLGLKRRLVATIEWLRLLPKPGFFPQTAQTLDIGRPV